MICPITLLQIYLIKLIRLEETAKGSHPNTDSILEEAVEGPSSRHMTPGSLVRLRNRRTASTKCHWQSGVLEKVVPLTQQSRALNGSVSKKGTSKLVVLLLVSFGTTPRREPSKKQAQIESLRRRRRRRRTTHSILASENGHVQFEWAV